MIRMLTLTLMTAVLLLTPATSLAGDAVRIKLASGATWRGETDSHVEVTYRQRGVERTFSGRLQRAEDLYIVVASEIGSRTIFTTDLVSIGDGALDEQALRELDDRTSRRNAATSSTAGSRGAASRPSASGMTYDAAAPGVFVLPMSGQVGVEFRHEEIEKLAAEVDRFGPGQIVVLQIDSPGGFLAETDDIHRIVTELKDRHRVVAWIEQALSSACAVAVMCDEIYFTSEGTAGAATPTLGGSAAPDAIFERWQDMMGSWMEETGRPRIIAEAMIDSEHALSYSRDDATGDVQWYDDVSGEHVLSGEGENLTFNASVAVHSGFAQGVADTPAELAALLDLPRWNEKSDYGRRLHAQWHRTVDRAKKEIPKIGPRLGFLTNSGDRIRDLTQAIKIQREALRWWKVAPNVARQQLPPEQNIKQNIENNEHTLLLLRQRERNRDRDGRGGGR